MTLQLSRNGRIFSTPVECSASGADGHAVLHIADPDLWWPHTHGVPALYAATLCIHLPTGEMLNVALGNIGFRRIVLDRTDDGFGLDVNGVRIFCRGSVWTPLDVVSLHSEPEDYARALEQVRSAGMNMLRVAGTMIYESNEFYDRCDQLGLLVWQDFMFAEMDYPESDSGFRQAVKREARQVLGAISHHPCLALLCGNSEVEQQAAMWGHGRDLWAPALFHEDLAGYAKELCPELPYWPSSTHGGTFPHQVSAGTCSYYGVSAYLRGIDDLRRSELRFATECLAFSQVPEPATLDAMPGGRSIRVTDAPWKARVPRYQSAGWDFDDVRDHYLTNYLKVDAVAQRQLDPERYLELSRRVPGELMSQAFGEWRRKGSTCQGALTLLLRDLWLGPGWGIIAADGRPKATYYYLRRALQPRSVHITDEGLNGISVHVNNDGPQPLRGELTLTLYRDREFQVASAARPLVVAAQASLEFVGTELLGHFYDLAYAYRFGPANYDLVVATLTTEDGTEALQSFFFCGSTGVELASVGLVASAQPSDSGAYELLVQSRAFAHSVVVETEGYHCDEQYFHLAPGKSKRLLLRPVGATAGALRGTVSALNSRQPVSIAVRQ